MYHQYNSNHSNTSASSPANSTVNESLLSRNRVIKTEMDAETEYNAGHLVTGLIGPVCAKCCSITRSCHDNQGLCRYKCPAARCGKWLCADIRAPCCHVLYTPDILIDTDIFNQSIHQHQQSPLVNQSQPQINTGSINNTNHNHLIDIDSSGLINSPSNNPNQTGISPAISIENGHGLNSDLNQLITNNSNKPNNNQNQQTSIVEPDLIGTNRDSFEEILRNPYSSSGLNMPPQNMKYSSPSMPRQEYYGSAIEHIASLTHADQSASSSAFVTNHHSMTAPSASHHQYMTSPSSSGLNQLMTMTSPSTNQHKVARRGLLHHSSLSAIRKTKRRQKPATTSYQQLPMNNIVKCKHCNGFCRPSQPGKPLKNTFYWICRDSKCRKLNGPIRGEILTLVQRHFGIGVDE